MKGENRQTGAQVTFTLPVMKIESHCHVRAQRGFGGEKASPKSSFIPAKLWSPQWHESSILYSWHNRVGSCQPLACYMRKRQALLQFHTTTKTVKVRHSFDLLQPDFSFKYLLTYYIPDTYEFNIPCLYPMSENIPGASEHHLSS